MIALGKEFESCFGVWVVAWKDLGSDQAYCLLRSALYWLCYVQVALSQILSVLRSEALSYFNWKFYIGILYLQHRLGLSGSLQSVPLSDCLGPKGSFSFSSVLLLILQRNGL